MGLELPIESCRAESAGVTPIDDPFRAGAMKALMGLVFIEPLAIIVVLMVLGVPGWVYLLVLGCGVVLPAIIIWLIVALAWNPNARRWPAQPIGCGAVSKSWQSFAFGRFNRLNNCLTIIADEQHLHLVPFALFRVFGAKRISLPMDRMAEIKPALGWSMMSARIDGRLIFAPTWCMKLASPEPVDVTT